MYTNTECICVQENNCEQSVSLGVQFSILDPERFVFQTLLSPDDSDGGEYQSLSLKMDVLYAIHRSILQ